ncbi:MAG: hypothetical protein IJ583_06760 [Firmicutes bacterium]|nr:hypothetical protein [Bacillota bacterium]
MPKENLKEKKINELSLSLIETKIRNELAGLIYNLTYFTVNPVDTPLHSDITALNDEILSLYYELPNVLKLSPKERISYNESLTAVKNKVKKTALPLLTLNYLSDIITDSASRSLLANSDMPLDVIDSYTLNKLKLDCYDYITENGTFGTIPYVRISDIISMMPLCMTKSNFIDILTRSFNVTFSPYSKDFLDEKYLNLKTMIAPHLSEDFHKYCPEISKKIEEAFLSPLPEDNDSLAALIADINDKSNSVNDIISVLSSYYDSVTILMIISTYCLDEEYLLGEDIILKDLYYSSLNKENKDFFCEEVHTRSEEKIEEQNDELKALEAALSSTIKGVKEFSEETRMYIRIIYNINNLSKEDIYSWYIHPYDNSEQVVEADSIRQKTEEFISYINSLDIPSNKFKLLKQYFLGNIMVDMSPDELFNYFDLFAERAAENNEYKIAAVKLHDFISEYISENHPVHHHHHDHCDCGHDHHHHDHDHCDCGHEHHHH